MRRIVIVNSASATDRGDGIRSRRSWYPEVETPRNRQATATGTPSAASSWTSRKPHFGRTFSLAKYADARLRVSFSISSTRNRRLSSTSSLCSSVVRPGLRPESTASRFIQFRRQDSLIPSSRAVWPTGFPWATRPGLDAGTPAGGQQASHGLLPRRSSPQSWCPGKRGRLPWPVLRACRVGRSGATRERRRDVLRGGSSRALAHRLQAWR